MAARIKIEIPELGKLLAKLDGEKLIKRRVRSTLRKGGNLVRTTMRREAPRQKGRPRGSGKTHTPLSRSIKAILARDGQSVTIKPTAPHRYMVHSGVKPHVIRPKRAKALAFGGRVVRYAKHPGQAANRYIDRTRAAAESDVRETLRELASEIEREWKASR